MMCIFQLDREHEAYCQLQSQQRYNFIPNPAVKKSTLPIIHSNNHTKNTQQTEALPAPPSSSSTNNNKSDTTTSANKDGDKASSDSKKLLPSLPPPPKHTVKTKSTTTTSPKAFSPVKKKTVVKPKLPIRTTTLKLPLRSNAVTQTTTAATTAIAATGEMSESSSTQELLSLEREEEEEEKNEQFHVEEQEVEEEQQELPSPVMEVEEENEIGGVQEEQTDDANDTSMYDEPLPGLNTVTPPTKSREPKVLHVSNAEVEREGLVGTEPSSETREVGEQLAMSNSMNVDTRAEEKPRKPEEQPTSPRQELQLQQQQQQNKTMGMGSGVAATFSKQSPPPAVQANNVPPIVHRPDEFDPESIDTICAEIYERKRQNGCAKFPLCLCNQTPCAKKSLTSSLRLKNTSVQEML